MIDSTHVSCIVPAVFILGRAPVFLAVDDVITHIGVFTFSEYSLVIAGTCKSV